MRQFALQGAAVILVLSIPWPYYGWSATALPWQQTSLLIGAVALFLASISRQPWWWRVIHAGFDDPPALARDAASEDEALSHYRRVRDEIRAFVEGMPENLAR